MNKITKTVFSALILISGFVWGDEMDSTSESPDGLVWFVKIVNQTSTQISVGKTIPGRYNYWNLAFTGQDALLNYGQIVEAHSTSKQFVTYELNSLPPAYEPPAYVEFYIDTELVSLNGQRTLPPKTPYYIYYFYVLYNGTEWKTSYNYPNDPKSTAAVIATITYGGKNNITTDITYCPENCY